jgi:tetratricopeptide (TPR) repeat protein
VARARDSWTGCEVIQKTQDAAAALREARCLLSLPRGVAPGFLDLLGNGPSELTLVLDHLDGRTLLDAAAEMPPAQLPSIARAICQRLAEVHRTGWLHADIKPENILVPKTGDATDIRLLDFGFAIDLFGSSDVEERGGTPPYMAPELRRGWIVDGRADLYSLGVVLDEVLPGSGRDPRWAPILEKLLQDLPAKRPSSAIGLRDDIAGAFDLTEDPQRFPRFGAGPMRGRATEIAAVRDRAGTGARILVQARRGTGLSRFLREASIALAAAGSGAGIIDLGEVRSPDGLDRAFASLEQAAAEKGIVLCGIPDPSPGLHGLADSIRSRLLRILSEPGWVRFSLPPLDVEGYREIVIASLGGVDAAADELARGLSDRTEGDLSKAAEGFLQAVRGGGSENGLKWKLDRAAAQDALADWSPGTIPPSLREAPASLRTAVGACARAGRSFPEKLARGLLHRFGKDAELEALLDHGLLFMREAERVEFATRGLWREAFADPPFPAQEIDRWLSERYDPSLDRIDDVLQACTLARRTGNSAKETHLLTQALSRAVGQRRKPDILAMLVYPEAPPPVWTVEEAHRHLAKLKEIVDPQCSEDWLLAVAGDAIRSVDVPVGAQLMERAAESRDPMGAVYSLTQLIGRVASDPSSPLYDKYLQALEGWEGVPGGSPPGLTDYFRAMRGFTLGHVEEARAHAEIAARKLRGSGNICEALSQQMGAVILYDSAPEEAAAAMRAAIEVSQDPETEAQLRYNLAIMYDRLGMPEKGLECTEPAIPRLRNRASRAYVAHLQVQRCLELVSLDRIDQAREELEALIALPSNRYVLIRLASLRGSLSLCHLHRGNGREALRQAALIVSETAQGAPLKMLWIAIADLIDVLVDLDSKELLHEHLPALRRLPTGEEVWNLVVAARLEALHEFGEGRLEDATVRLEGKLPDALGLHRPVEYAQILHQLGSLRLVQGTDAENRAMLDRARILFEEEIEALPRRGYGYHRARARLALGRTFAAAGDRDHALETLTQAIDLAREIKSLRLLAQGLESRARLEMRPL